MAGGRAVQLAEDPGERDGAAPTSGLLSALAAAGSLPPRSFTAAADAAVYRPDRLHMGVEQKHHDQAVVGPVRDALRPRVTS